MNNTNLVRVLTVRTDTAKYTLEDLDNEVTECIRLLMCLGLPERYTFGTDFHVRVAWNEKMPHWLGQTTRIEDGGPRGKRRFLIQINHRYVLVSDPATVHETIMHEVVHTLTGCFNHGVGFKTVGLYLDQIGFHLSRLASKDEVKTYLDLMPYAVQCTTCGTKSQWQRCGKAFKAILMANKCSTTPENLSGGYSCGKCHHHTLKVIRGGNI